MFWHRNAKAWNSKHLGPFIHTAFLKPLMWRKACSKSRLAVVFHIYFLIMPSLRLNMSTWKAQKPRREGESVAWAVSTCRRCLVDVFDCRLNEARTPRGNESAAVIMFNVPKSVCKMSLKLRVLAIISKLKEPCLLLNWCITVYVLLNASCPVCLVLFCYCIYVLIVTAALALS